MASLGTLTLNLVAKTAGFVQGMGKAERNSAKWRKSVQRDIKAVSKTLSTTLKVSAVAAAAGLSVIVNRSRETIDSLGKTADKIGVTTEALAGLRFAAEQTGVSQRALDVGLQRFTRRLADAADGAGPAVKAFEELNLRAEDLVNLSPDQALGVVADALQDVDSQTRRVAIAFKLFDSEGVGLVNTLAGGSEGLAALGAEAEAAGVALNRIDVAKVEQANDAINRVGTLASGAGQQLTVALAPALTAVADAAFQAATEGDGMGESIQRGVDQGVRAVAFLINGADGVKRAFEAAADGIVLSILGWKGVALEAARVVLQAYNDLPFTDRAAELDSLQQAITLNNQTIAQTTQNLRGLLETPLAGESFLDAYNRALIESQSNAAAVAASRGANIVGGGDSLSGISGSEEADAQKRFEDAQALLLDAQRRYNALKETETLRHLEWENAITAQSKKQQVDIYANAFTGISDSARVFAGEQSGIYRTLFAIEKSAAVARSIVAIQTAIAQASASLPFPANLGAMAKVVSATAGLVSNIMGTQIQGQFHDGIMSVPQTGSYLLEKGERVSTAQTSKKMDTMIDEARQGGMGGPTTIVAALGDDQIERMMGGKVGERVFLAHLRSNQATVRAMAGV